MGGKSMTKCKKVLNDMFRPIGFYQTKFIMSVCNCTCTQTRDARNFKCKFKKKKLII